MKKTNILKLSLILTGGMLLGTIFLVLAISWTGPTVAPPGGNVTLTIIPSGVIVMWSGTLATIPTGWALADGTNGTPNLRDRFIMGVAPGENPGATGGSATLPNTVGAHTHTIDPPNTSFRLTHGMSNTPGGRWRFRVNHITQHINIPAFTSGPASATYTNIPHLPPYFKLAFIMKL